MKFETHQAQECYKELMDQVKRDLKKIKNKLAKEDQTPTKQEIIISNTELILKGTAIARATDIEMKWKEFNIEVANRDKKSRELLN